MSRLIPAFVLGCLVTLVQDSEFGRRIPPKDAQSGERLQFIGVTADLDALRQAISGVTILSVGADVVEIRRTSGLFTDEEVREFRRIVKEHHEARVKAGRSGITEKPRRARAPEEWRRKYAAAETDAAKLEVMASYLGLAE
jgi:hypothetical protein